VNAPKESDSSKLLNGIAAKGSKDFLFVGSEVEDFVSAHMPESGAAKGSNVAVYFGSEESKTESDAPNKSALVETGAGKAG